MATGLNELTIFIGVWIWILLLLYHLYVVFNSVYCTCMQFDVFLVFYLLPCTHLTHYFTTGHPRTKDKIYNWLY